jgi:hypothetical protein
VVKALAAISQTETTPFRPVFGGGTALSRAHRLIRRMPEDIDLKIVSYSEFARAALRNLRDAITNALLKSGFEFDPTNPVHRESGNASRYTWYRLPSQRGHHPIQENYGRTNLANAGKWLPGRDLPKQLSTRHSACLRPEA